ncbi:MAG: phenylalanine--tRNA ligase beta subunit-related protein [Vagococcus sp.]
MKKMIIDPTFFQVFPEGQVNLLVLNGIDNQIKESDEQYFYDLLQKSAKEAHNHLTEDTFTDNEVIAEWREAFRQFKTKKGARSSIEALLKRVSQDREFHPINPLVDIYNSISLTFAVPCGGEDIETIEGNLVLKKATGGESFRPLGAEEDAPALPEEIIHADDKGAICRSLNWREAQRTMLTENTKHAVLVIESIKPRQSKQADLAMAAMKQLVEDYFQIKTTAHVLNQEQPEAIIA